MGRVFRCTKEYSRSSTVRCDNATSYRSTSNFCARFQLYIYLDLLVLSLYFGAAARGDTWILVGFYWARSCTACFFCTQFPIIRA